MSGLNKAARLAAERAERELAKREAVVRLEPDFPYEPVGFDPLFFEVESSEAERVKAES